ncbi:MAG TPA: hypothetical protein VKU36_03380 [Candidatus Babeliales bacterium]|nr:hypothetical protein [Candidatus Babeliales bacterium]
MNIQKLKKQLLTNIPLIIISLFLGYSFWYIATYDQTVMFQLNVPLCFAASADNCTLQAPENIQITLQAKRTDMYALDKDALAAHINISKLLPGKHGILLTEQHLFLPNSITLVHYKPSNLTVTIAAQDNA